MVVDAANEGGVGFHTKFGFRPVSASGLRLFLQAGLG
jgi:hypothetical protein